MSKSEKNKILITNEGNKRLDFSINVSHGGSVSNKRVIQLVKLLARLAAEEDYRQSSFIQNQGGKPYEKAR